jgi:DNA-directed RNA polymerase specialized sigma24 family protein
MCDCTPLITAIKKGSISLERALLQIVKEKDECDFKKISRYVYNRYCFCCRETHTWEDLFYAALMRFIQAVERGNEPRNKNCRPFFFQICKFVCFEWCRSEKKLDAEPEPQKEEGYSKGWMEDMVV